MQWGHIDRGFFFMEESATMATMKKLTALLVLLTLVFTGCMSRRHSEEEFYFGNYSEAESFYNRKQYDKALQRYQAYVDENPEGNLAVIAKYYMGRCHAALGHIDEAKSIYQNIAARHSDLVWGNFAENQLKELENPGSVKAPEPAAPSYGIEPKPKKKKKFLFF